MTPTDSYFERFDAAMTSAMEGPGTSHAVWRLLSDACDVIESRFNLAAFVVREKDHERWTYALYVSGDTDDLLLCRIVPPENGDKAHVRRFGQSTYDVEVGDSPEENWTRTVDAVESSLADAARALIILDADTRYRRGIDRKTHGSRPY
jgi:hypothetical protein